MMAIRSPLLVHYENRDEFEAKFYQLLKDSELILGTRTHGIEIIANRFLENWKYEPILVILKFIDEMTKGVFKKVHKNVLDLPTLNNFFAEFKEPYIEALEYENRAKDKGKLFTVDYQAYKERMKNYKGEKYEQAKRFSEYLGRYHKNMVYGDGIIPIDGAKAAQDPGAGPVVKDTPPEERPGSTQISS